MLRPETEMDDIEFDACHIAPCADRKLLHNEKAYRAFVERPRGLGMLDATLRPRERIGISSRGSAKRPSSG